VGKKRRKWTADEVRACIEMRFDITGNGDSKKSVVFHEVPTGTGFGVGWVDSVVCELWPSNGWTRRAIEIKVSRADFLHELEHFEKSAWARAHFHEFWFCSPPDIIKPGETPEGCGLYHTRAESIIVKTAARRNEAQCTDQLVAALMRSAEKSISSAYARAEGKALAESSEFQRMKAIAEGVEKFFDLKNEYIHDPTPDGIFEKLCKSTIGDIAKAEHERVMGQVGEFRQKILALLTVMIPLSFLGLLEADELGRSYFRSFGLRDRRSWAEILKRAKRDRVAGSGDMMKALKQIIELFGVTTA
jgi:hypothetical protein